MSTTSCTRSSRSRRCYWNRFDTVLVQPHPDHEPNRDSHPHEDRAHDQSNCDVTLVQLSGDRHTLPANKKKDPGYTGNGGIHLTGVSWMCGAAARWKALSAVCG